MLDLLYHLFVGLPVLAVAPRRSAGLPLRAEGHRFDPGTLHRLTTEGSASGTAG